MKSDSRPYILSLILLLSSISAFSQFHYKRELKGVKSNFHELILPPEMVGKCKDGLVDLRIMRNDLKDSIEVPYILQNEPSGPIVKEIPHEIIDRSGKDGLNYATISLGHKSVLSTIELIFEAKPFDSSLKLEGSYDNKTWYTLLEKERIGGINIDGKFYRYSTLKFASSQYGYYRVSYPTGTPQLLNASITLSSTRGYKPENIGIASIQNEGNKEADQTISTLSLAGMMPVERIKLSVDAGLDYRRPVSIYAATDSAAVNGKYNYEYELVSSGLLTSWSDNIFSFERVITNRIRVVIDNGDDQPLNMKTPELTCSQTSILIRFGDPKQEYAVYYGAPEIDQPNYELSYLRDRIPGELISLTMENEEDLRKPIKSRSPLDLSTTWLWGVLGLIMVAMAGFVVNMWKKKG